MVGQPDVGNPEFSDFDSIAIEYEIELLAGRPAGVRGQTLDIGAAEPGGLHKQVYLVLAPECVEIAGDDYRFLTRANQVVQMAQLIMPMAVFQRQMDQEHGQVFKFKFNNQALDAGIHVVKPFAVYPRRGQEGVNLFTDDRQTFLYGLFPVLALVDRVMQVRGKSPYKKVCRTSGRRES